MPMLMLNFQMWSSANQAIKILCLQLISLSMLKLKVTLMD